MKTGTVNYLNKPGQVSQQTAGSDSDPGDSEPSSDNKVCKLNEYEIH